MKQMTVIFGIMLLMLVSGCSRTEEPSVLVVYHEGNEYHILNRGDTTDAGYPAYFVRYYSANVAREKILEAERSDLCTIIAKHIDTNKHQRVTVSAVERKGRLFGLMEPREISASLSLEEVLRHHPDAKTPGDQ